MAKDRASSRVPSKRSPLERLCFEARLSFSQLASEAKLRGGTLHYTTVSRINSGDREFLPRYAEEIAGVLRDFGVSCDPDFLRRDHADYLLSKLEQRTRRSRPAAGAAQPRSMARSQALR